MSKDTLDKLIDKVNKSHGAGVIRRASDVEDQGVLPTPFASVNALIKGIPRGRFTCIAGPQHVGKGVFCAQLAAHHQEKDPEFTVLWSDFENALDLNWLEQLGVDLDRVLVQKYTSGAATMETALDSALDMIKTQKVNLWIIDSVGALLPKSDIMNSKGEDRSLEEQNMLNLQRKLGEFFRKANIFISPDQTSGYKGCATVLIGQVYTVPSANVSIEEVRGGNSLKHWAHLRLLLRRGPRKEGPDPIKVMGLDGKPKQVYPGWSCRIKVDKTRLNDRESQEILLPFFYGRGFDSVLSTVGTAMALGIITRAGAYYNCSVLPDKVQGKDGLMKAFTTDPKLLEQLAALVDQRAAESKLEEISSDDLVEDDPQE